ncbi:MAG: heavy-metal-associated domain-containing protein [Prochloraceae cyanobacterium]|nr:heavy-metal-associated domain-containing protein [Prochloraceae cyanobacterium]
MTIKLKVPTIVCDGCSDKITEAIKNQYPNSSVSVDKGDKIVTVEETEASPESIKELITSIGHTVE